MSITAFEYFAILMKPRIELREQLGHLADSFVDIELGCGPILDILGDLEGEPRSGLTDEEYRKIIRGRRIAKYGMKSYPGIWLGWEIIVGPDPVSIEMTALNPATVFLTAEVDYLPSELFISRAGRVVGDLVPVGYEIDAWIAQPGGLQWDEENWDEENWAYALETKQ